MAKLKQASPLPIRKLITGMLTVLLTGLVGNTTLDLSPESITTLSVCIGGLIAYYTPPAPRDYVEEA